MLKTRPWDYLIITAANDQQAESYEFQLRERLRAGKLPEVRNCLVIADIDGRRMGSGGSTLHCLGRVLERECDGGVGSFYEAEAVLSELRILILHAGGDSRRLPAYSHCGKMFVPVPNRSSHGPATLFDRLVPELLALPEAGAGQVVIASGDALILFDPSTVDLSRPGITALGSWASVKEAAQHGVFSIAENGTVTRYLQKPSREEQLRAGAIDENGRSLLDLGVMSCDASAAVQLMRAFFIHIPRPHGEPSLFWRTKSLEFLHSYGIDLYREICCALGSETRYVQYAQHLRAGRSSLESSLTSEWFHFLHPIPLNVCILPHGEFLHFGTTRQLVTSGIALLEKDFGKPANSILLLNSKSQEEIQGRRAWIEGCSIEAKLVLEGLNVVVGADITEPLTLSKGACFDLSMGTSHEGAPVWFLRCYGVNDSFKQTEEAGGTFCGVPLGRWIDEMDGKVSDVWPADVPKHERTLWNARVFPALKEHQEFPQWLWLLRAGLATAEQKKRFWAADRYSSSEIATRVDQPHFQARRAMGSIGIPKSSVPQMQSVEVRIG
jgi:fucokinase